MRAPLVALALAAACGGGAGVSIDELPQREVDAYCAQAVRCHEYADTDSCAADLDPASFRLPPVIQRAFDPSYAGAVAAGVASYDSSAAADCVDALEAISCDSSARDVRIAPDACNSIFLGSVAGDGSCGFDSECASGRCAPPAQCPDDYACCLGTCASPPHTAAIGDPCAIDSDCADDGFCSGTGCHALLGSGESCTATSQCAFGTACIQPIAGQAGECAVPPQLGEACPGHVCGPLGTFCGSGGTCVAIGLPGTACTSDGQCGISEVCDGATSTCARPPQLGQPCASACAPGAWCDTSMNGGTCVAPLADTTECAYDEQCASLNCAEGEFATTCIEKLVCF